MLALALCARQRGREAIIEMPPIAKSSELIDSGARFRFGESLHMVRGVFADREDSRRAACVDRAEWPVRVSGNTSGGPSRP